MNTKALRYNTGKTKWSLVHFKSIEPLARGLMYGEHKYSLFQSPETGEQFKGSEVSPENVKRLGLNCIASGRDNWKNEMNLNEIFDSAQRHLASMIDGELHDPESGELHAGHLMDNMMFWVFHYNKKLEQIQEEIQEEIERQALPF